MLAGGSVDRSALEFAEARACECEVELAANFRAD
jgi:hypothetical protein